MRDSQDIGLTLPADPTSSLRPDPRGPTVILDNGLGESARPRPRNRTPFILRQQLGRGAFGEVWESIQVTLDRIVAVKRPKVSDRRKCAASELLEGMFEREALIAAQLDHPNIVPVYDLGHDEDGAPLVGMKLVEGTRWDELLVRDASMPLGDLLFRHLPILVFVARAVGFAHSRNVIHRDLKPSQVVVGDFGQVFLMDWGLAVKLEAPGPFDATNVLHVPRDASNPAGTVAFMAPEQTDSDPDRLGPWTDIYLLGGILFHILTGTYPHPQMNSEEAFRHAASEEVPPPDVVAPERRIPRELSALCVDAMQRNPSVRIPDAQTFVQRIEHYLSGVSRREQSRELVVSTRQRLERAIDYEELEFCEREAAHALTLWSGNVEAREVLDSALERFADAAIRRGDLKLALSHALRITGDAGKTVVERVRKAERRAHLIAIQRRMAIVAALVLALAVVVFGVTAMRRRAMIRESEARIESATAREKGDALVAREEAAREQHRADLFAAISKLRETQAELSSYVHEEVVSALRIDRHLDWAVSYLESRPDLVKRVRDGLQEIKTLRQQVQEGGLPAQPLTYELLVAKGTIDLCGPAEDLADALDAFSEASKLEPASFEAASGMAIALARQDRLGEALDAALRAREIAKASPMISHGLSDRIVLDINLARWKKTSLGPDDILVESSRNSPASGGYQEITSTWEESDNLGEHKSTAPGLRSDIQLASSRHYFFYSPFVIKTPPPAAVARFFPRPKIPTGYHVYATWPVEANAAPVYYRVCHASGEVTHALAQDGFGVQGESNANMWTYLGEYQFAPGDAHYVELSAGKDARPLTPARPGYVTADAVLFARNPLQTDATTEPRKARLDAMPSVVDAPATGSLNWKEKLADALNESHRTNRPVLVFGYYPISAAFAHPLNKYRDYCEVRLFGDPGVSGILSRRYVLLKIDLMRNPEDRARLGLPDNGTSLRLLARDGRTVVSFAGEELMQSPSGLAALLEKHADD